MSTSRLHYLRRCFISVSQFIWRVFARKQRRVLAASYLYIFYLYPDMFVCLCVYVCICIPFLLALECFFRAVCFRFQFQFFCFLGFFCFSLFPLSHVIRSLFSYQFLARHFLFTPSSPSLSLSTLSVPVTCVCHESRSKSAFYKDLLRIVPLQCRQTQTQT